MGKLSDERSAEYLGIVDGLTQHGKGMAEVTEHIKRFIREFGLGAEFDRKAKDIETRLAAVQKDALSLISSLSSPSITSDSKENGLQGPPVIIRCKQWADFRAQASNANAVSYLYRDEEKCFQVDALKSGRVYTFGGQLPGNATLLKTWLSKELRVEEGQVLEGILAIG